MSRSRVIVAIDPGYTQSAIVEMRCWREEITIVSHAVVPNEALVKRLAGVACAHNAMLVVEQIASMGMPVGAEVFETVFWSGRFCQVWAGEWRRIRRVEVKMALCGDPRAKDANIRQAIIDRFGPGKESAIGKKASPGPLYGIKGDEWQALAVGLTWLEEGNRLDRNVMYKQEAVELREEEDEAGRSETHQNNPRKDLGSGRTR